MRVPSPLLLHGLVWLAAWLVLGCHRDRELSAIAPPPERVAIEARSPTPPPISLTASDGTGLALASLHARAVLDEPLVLTELELAFDNPGDQRMEGRFELLLPPGARVTRFALRADGEWQEAEVVEKQQARVAYETFLHEDRDPALLERDTGNRFSARVFPIEPHARKHVLVSYVESLADPSEPWRLGLRGLPWLERYEVEVRVTDPIYGTRALGKPLVSRGEPSEDFVVPRAAPHDDGVRHGERVLARVQPLAGLELDAGPPLRRLTVLFDTSASRALDFDASLLRLAQVLRALARQAGTAELQLLAFDQEVVPIYSGSLLGFGEAQLAALRARRPLGASDLGLALASLHSGEHQRVLLVSDGLISAGEDSDAALRRQLHALGRDGGVERLDALVLGAVRDEPRLQRLVAGPLPRSGVLLSPSLDPERVAARLVQPTLDGVRLEVPGARWWSPTRLDGLQPEDHVLVYAELPHSQAQNQPLHVQVSGPIHRELEIPLRPTSSPLHEHGWRRGQIDGLVERLGALQDALESERLRRHVVELSVRHRVFNDFTAFLVLESDDDYARFGLDRRALDDILVVGSSGAEVLHRAVEPEPEAEPEPPPAGDSVIDGVVRHSETREPLSGALVVLQCACLQATRELATTSGGAYEFTGLPPGTYTVQVLIGQAHVSKITTLGPAARARINFVVDPKAEFRRMVRVESRRSYRRRNRNRDDMMSADSFERRRTLPAPTGVKVPPAATPEPEPEPEELDGFGDGGFFEEDAEPEQEQPEPDVITVESTQGMTLSMEELRNIPVGNATSRDYTAVVETSATASSDSAGISLAGATAAESYYGVEGANISMPSKPKPARVVLLGTRVERSNLRRRAARAAMRANLEPLERCYHRALIDEPKLHGRLVVQLRTDTRGHVRTLGKLDRRRLDHDELLRCIERSIQAWVLPPRTATITQTLLFLPNDGPPGDYWSTADDDAFEPVDEGEAADAYRSELAQVRDSIARGERDRALVQALAWRERDAIDVLALVALGDAAAARGDLRGAARAYGSILDLYPTRADMLRFAAGLLEALGDPGALALAIDAYGRAVEQRPDQPTGRRNLAFALLHRGDPEAAFDVLVQALARRYPPDRFLGVQQVLKQDLGIVAAAWRRQQPTRASTIHERLAELGVPLATEPSLRFVLTWETDVSDVDLHVQDVHGAQAHGESPALPSGGELLVDVSRGYGPELFTVPGSPSAYPYRLTVHAYDRGPTGFGLGKVQVLHHDGEGGVHLDDRPFVALEDDAWITLGEVQPPPPPVAAAN